STPSTPPGWGETHHPRAVTLASPAALGRTNFVIFRPQALGSTPHPASRQLSTACGDPAHAPSPQVHPPPVEFAQNFALRADVFVHTPSARCENIRSVMPAKPPFRRALAALFHSVAGSSSAEFTPR